MASYKYKAFISYSHADEIHGSWLQRALEGYRLPSALVGRETPLGAIPRRLTPIFRDRNDLPAAGSLSGEIQAALRDSQFLIVICSPRAAVSRWVDEETRYFKSVHGTGRTLAVIVEGEPGAAAKGQPEIECFPPALRFEIDDAGALTATPAEPVAADARPAGDGRRYAVLKLVAGLVGVGLDDLVRREAQRRARAAWSIAGLAGGVATVMAIVSIYAVRQRDEARLMRGKAEDLVEFMIGDLKTKVEPLGRTDALEAIGGKALSYYASQDERRLDADALSRRARALVLVGQINQKRNDLDAALKAYATAAASTGELLRRAPNDPQRIFDHAQSVFYVGYVAVKRNDMAQGEAQMNEYLRLAEQLVAIDPKNPDWRLEFAYATNNLGAMKFKASDFAAAIEFFDKSADARRVLYEARKDDDKVALAYAYALSWSALAELRRGDFKKAEEQFARQFAVYDQMLARDQDDYRVLHPYAIGWRRLAETKLYEGDISAAADSLNEARRIADLLQRRDPSNAEWKSTAAGVELGVSQMMNLQGKTSEVVAPAARAAEMARALYEADKSDVETVYLYAETLAGALEPSTGREADRLADELMQLSPALDSIDVEGAATAYGAANLALARYQTGSGSPLKARQTLATATARLEKISERLAVDARLSLLELAIEAGDGATARAEAAKLSALGVRHPRFLALEDRLSRLAAN